MHSGTDTPLASEVVDGAGDNLGYRWLLTSKERAHIAGLLNCAGMYSSLSPCPVDLPPSYPSSQHLDDITLRGNIMNRERSVCKGCGKHSGLDDLVHNALYLNIHTPTFMLDVLQNGPKNDSPAHWILCSGCGVRHEEQMGWALGGGIWNRDGEKRAEVQRGA
ncbi:hypothetical protein G7Y79_00074g098630 [Physcia stellaris]|nr:hypothetical protein G7Y79_00074g098630 [Physcia stellaris]